MIKKNINKFEGNKKPNKTKKVAVSNKNIDVETQRIVAQTLGQALGW